MGTEPRSIQPRGFKSKVVVPCNRLKSYTIRGSIVGTRLDLREALDFASNGKVRATVATEPLENINDILDRLRKGDIQGRIVIDFES